MEKAKLQSVNQGFEWELSQDQIEFLKVRMFDYQVGRSTVSKSVQGKRYGFIEFQMPKNGYFSMIGENQFKRLQEMARKSHTTLYITNSNFEGVYDSDAPRIMFVAQAN